ncbi:putative hemolysin [Propionicimonas paludicola]|uniref:Putative hemolysin n=1 Tax=Propionicimonas paludicola TaxID=185243 RepID=A0A2A9CP35_9ACTN|nr:hemolysin family protein [Propionicimonas paludicola]PFG15845.1 putative hemolysin [Propionicimonas paludicola]
MSPIVGDIALIALFIVIGGVFAAAEMALVSLRESQIRQLSGRGQRGRTVANLTSDPNRFLSAVQIGVTLAGFLSAAFGGATLADALSIWLIGLGLPTPLAGPLSLVLVTLVISYFSIVLGELAAKRLAMQRAEAFALALAPLVSTIAWLATPVIWFLGKSTDVVVRVFGGDPKAGREEVTDEELRAMVGSSATLGDEERQIVDEVFAAGEVVLREAMIPRTEVDFLDGDLTVREAYLAVQQATHSRYPVIGEDSDDVLGFVHIRDLAVLDPQQRQAPVRDLVRPVMSLPQSVKILRALSEMRQNKQHLVIVRDEYGGTAGIVTIEDLVEELIGEITDEFDAESEPMRNERDQAELDGLMTLQDFADEFGYVLPEGPYDTVAGFLMAQLGTLPDIGASCQVSLAPVEDGPWMTFELTVAELDGRRAARLKLVNLGPQAAAE